MLVSELEGKKILIVGFGREGQDSFLFLRKKFPEKAIGIADQKEFEQFPDKIRELLKQDRSVILYFGSSYLKALHTYEVIIKSPGIPARVIQSLLKKKQTLTSQTNLFFENCPGGIIGVTGTKGKSTTSALIYEVLKAGGLSAHLIGNIEKPALGFLEKATKDDMFVYELSSFQLESITKSPHIAVFLNLYPEHLDYHGTLKSYLKAKANITKFQTKENYLIFNSEDEMVRKVAASSKAQKISFHPKRKKGALIAASTEPAMIIGKIFGVSKKKIEAALAQFKPLPHRLEFIGKWLDISFYNDSLATIPQATISALDILGNDVHTLIAGGLDRGISYEELAKRILQSNIETLILFPSTGNKLWKEITKLEAKKAPAHHFVSTMASAVQLAYAHTPKKKICLLSPASASFNLFTDYKQRGNDFKKFAALYGKKKHS